MASKLLAIVALACAVQGLNAAVVMRPLERDDAFISSGFIDSVNDQLHAMEKEYGYVIDQFENVVMNTEAEGPEAEFAGYFDNIMNFFTSFANTDMNEESAAGVDREVVRKCIREQIPAFQKLVQTVRQRVIDARVKLRQFIVDTIGPYVKNAREAFRVLAAEIAAFPGKIYQCIQDREFMKIFEVIRNTREIVRANAAAIAENLRNARGKFPLIRETAQQMMQQIQNEAREGVNVIRTAIRQCIENGGPKEFFTGVIPQPFPGQELSLAENQVPEVSNLLAPADAVISRAE